MEPQKQIQDFIHTCALMATILTDGRSMTDLETQLLEAHLRQVMAKLEMRKLCDLPVRAQPGHTAPPPGELQAEPDDPVRG